MLPPLLLLSQILNKKKYYQKLMIDFENNNISKQEIKSAELEMDETRSQSIKLLKKHLHVYKETEVLRREKVIEFAKVKGYMQ